MLIELVEKGAVVTLCGTCCQTRGLLEFDIVNNAVTGTIHDLASLVRSCDKVISL
jgi:sulfur relay (sulfurtransferase) complex TusBCD TusD component (DsrE family)